MNDNSTGRTCCREAIAKVIVPTTTTTTTGLNAEPYVQNYSLPSTSNATMLGRIIMSRGAGRRWQQQQQQRAAAGARSRDAATRRHSPAALTNDGRSAATRSRGQTDRQRCWASNDRWSRPSTVRRACLMCFG